MRSRRTEQRYWRRSALAAGRSDAGVGDQAPSGGCPHSDDALPCLDCLIDGRPGGER